MALMSKVDPVVARQALAEWLRERLPGADDIAVVDLTIPRANGLSSESIVFDATWTQDGAPHRQGLVARLAPTGGGIYPEYDLPKEARVMRALAAHTPVPAPGIWSADDDALLGTPMIVMERRVGSVPPDDPPYTKAGWVLDLAPADQHALVDHTLAVLADVHRADWRDLGLQELAPAADATPLDREFAYWERYYAWAAGGHRTDLIDHALAWARAHRPTGPEHEVLCWGDVRLGNVMFAPDNSVTGVFDWEMAMTGAPGLDVGWFLFQLRHHSEGFGVPLPPGFPGRDAIVARYEELSGRPLEHMAFYEVWAGIRATIMMLKIGTAMIELGAIPANSALPVTNICTVLLSEQLGLEGAASVDLGGWLDGSR